MKSSTRSASSMNSGYTASFHRRSGRSESLILKGSFRCHSSSNNWRAWRTDLKGIHAWRIGSSQSGDPRDSSESWRMLTMLLAPSLRAKRSNPDCRRGEILDCFAPLALTMGRECAQLDHRHPEVRAQWRNRAAEQASKGDGPAASWPPILRGSACDALASQASHLRMTEQAASSLRAPGNNPESSRGGILDCFVARAPRNDDGEKAFPPSTPIPTPQIPRRHIPPRDIRHQAIDGAADDVAREKRQEHVGLAEDLVDPDQQCGALDRIELLLRGLVGLVGLGIGPARDVSAEPLVVFGRDLPGDALVQKPLRIWLRLRRVVHLHVAIEFRVGVGVADVRREEHRCGDRLELDVDAGALAGLLDDGLRLLAWRVDRCLEHEFELPAALLADAVRAHLPAGLVEDPVRLLDVEFVGQLARLELRGLVDEARRCDAAAAVDVFLDRVAIDQQVDRPANGRIGQRRVFGLEAGTLAVDLGPRVRHVED